MTRVLADLLHAAQPHFSMTIRDLEHAAGKPSKDIALASEVLQRARLKATELGLDPSDTTEEELYQALMTRLDRDETTIRRALELKEESTTEEILSAAVQCIENLHLSHKTFALKTSVAKRLLKKHPPKRVMKQLHYRSLDSMLKHEPVAQVYVAAYLCESLAWRKKFMDQYKLLQPRDFETREIITLVPTAARWSELAEQAVNTQRHSVMVVKELGAIVALPLSQPLPGLTITTFILLANALNDIASAGSFLKLQQVKPDFGAVVKSAIEQEPVTSARLVDRVVPWRVVHQYYARFANAYNPVIFEPHIQADDLHWVHPEALLAHLHPSLEFWKDTRYTAWKTGQTIVSFNVFDLAISCCNRISYGKHTIHFMQQQLWNELMVRYLDHDNVEQAIVGELALQPEPIPIDG